MCKDGGRFKLHHCEMSSSMRSECAVLAGRLFLKSTSLCSNA